MNLYWKLFWLFARIGVCTFGGGYAMLPILQRELVEKRDWVREEELTDYFAIGQCTPGVIAINTATFVGHKLAGGVGGVIATLGVVFPSIVIIMVIAAFLQNFAQLPAVIHAFNGVRACVCALILSSVLKLRKSTMVDLPTVLIFAVVVVLAVVGNFVTFPAGTALAAVTGRQRRAETMSYLQLFYEFFKTGLFAIGGGLATIPFLTDMGTRTGWFTAGDLANMIAISESTPGPMGVNMATYVGFHVGGIPGGVIATLGLICPSIIVILVIAGFLKKFRESRGVDAVFYGIRPASTALIAAALMEVCAIALINTGAAFGTAEFFQWKSILLAVVVFACLQVKSLKKIHPIVFIAASAVVGVVFQF